MKQKGFTLIELLVVIAIIGILATIVLASLNSARVKANDVAVKSNLDNARAQAELFYDTYSQSYLTVCSAAGGISQMVTGANAQGGSSGTAVSNVATTAASATQAVCHDSAAGWAAQVPLKSDSTQSWCVDNTGVSKQEPSATGLPASAFKCA